MNLFKLKLLIFVTILTGTAAAAFGANVLVPRMDLTTRLTNQSQLQTRGDFQLSFDGGYKYQAQLMFQYYDTMLEDGTDAALVFDGAQASIRDILHIIDTTYFTGYYGILGEGKFYKGHLYHAEQGFDYNGYLPILGTGLIIGNSRPEVFEVQGFIYQQYGSNYINTVDLSIGLNLEPFVGKFFLGNRSSEYQMGTQLMYLGDETEIYLTIGNPSMVTGQKIDFDDFYLLLEEWFKMENWNLILSVFSRPNIHYNYVQRRYIETEEQTDLDFNFNLNYEPEASYFSGGGELNIQTTKSEALGVYLSPYVSLYTSGVTWKVKIDFNLISQTRDFLTAYLNINASF